MSRPVPIRPLSLRLPEELRTAAVELAKRRKTSLNKLIEGEIARAVEEEERERFREGYRILAREGVDVEYAFAAQSEVVLGGSSIGDAI